MTSENPLSFANDSHRWHPHVQLGYCTNVHAGTDLAAIRDNLSEFAVAAREQLKQTGHGDTLGVGLWIPNEAAEQLVAGQRDGFREFLAANGLIPYTINGFPYANFHGESVKQRVYLPTWAEGARLDYTQRLAEILADLLAADQPLGSISTLPLGWPDNPFAPTGDSRSSRVSADNALIKASGKQLRELAKFLQQLHQRTGKHIVVAIEPEPGCMLDTIDDMIEFFQSQLPEPHHRRYLTACHDICHSAVMNESQRQVIQRYADAGIAIGKIQVSNAIVANWSDMNSADHETALRQLGKFAEDRYLHQTGKIGREQTFQLAEDLPQLVRQTTPADLAAALRWVVHFHVPIFLQQFGLLSTSRDAVVECLQAIVDDSIGTRFTGHFEVETYAWTVLPSEMRQRGLAEDIAAEMRWLTDQLSVQVSKNRARR